MENELQMTLNRLPAPTWNWLKMNESHVAYDKTPVWFSASVEISGDGMVHTKEKVDGWDRIVSGVGRDLDKLGELAGGETDVLEVRLRKLTQSSLMIIRVAIMPAAYISTPERTAL